MLLNEYGQVSHRQREKLPERFTNTLLDVFQIMPNHFHGIIRIEEPAVGAGFTPAPDEHMSDVNVGFTPSLENGSDHERAGVNPAPKCGNIVGAYKSLVSKECLEIFKTNCPGQTMGKLFQRNYYEHIIRNEKSYNQIANYIVANPANWKDDMFYDDNSL